MIARATPAGVAGRSRRTAASRAGNLDEGRWLDELCDECSRGPGDLNVWGSALRDRVCAASGPSPRAYDDSRAPSIRRDGREHRAAEVSRTRVWWILWAAQAACS